MLPAADERAAHIKRSQLSASSTSSRRVRHEALRSQQPVLSVGDLDLLRSTDLRTDRQCRKLEDRFAGPFPIIAVINDVTYGLKLPPHWKIHNTFHISQL